MNFLNLEMVSESFSLKNFLFVCPCKAKQKPEIVSLTLFFYYAANGTSRWPTTECTRCTAPGTSRFAPSAPNPCQSQKCKVIRKNFTLTSNALNVMKRSTFVTLKVIRAITANIERSFASFAIWIQK